MSTSSDYGSSASSSFYHGDSMNDIYKNQLVFMPASIFHAIKARGINLEDFGNGRKAALDKLSLTEQALIIACNDCPVISRSVGQRGHFGFAYLDYPDDDGLKQIAMARTLADSEETEKSLKDQLGGEAGSNLCIEAISLGPYCTGIVFGAGAYDALNKDNNVLTLLTQVVEKALLTKKIHQLAGGMLGGLFERFIHVSAYANPTCRPSSPVFR